jgi:hypothetical protein
MGIIEIVQLIAVASSLIFVGYQSWLMRKALQEQRNEAKVQSYLQVWMNHIQTCHLPIATDEEATAKRLNSMSPYHNVDLPEARQCHFADAVFDFYECIQILSDTGILDDEVARVWRDSVPYEIRNASLQAHWRKFHHPGYLDKIPEISQLGIYHRRFMEMVERCIANAELMKSEAIGKNVPTEKR